jgi:hypothetical protein
MVRVIRSLPLWAKVSVPTVAAATLGVSGLALAGNAGATVSPTTTYNNTGVAGYYAAPNANRLGNGDHITGVRTTFFLRAAAENVGYQEGVELCQFQNVFSTSTQVVDLFTRWDSSAGVFDVLAAENVTSNCLDGLNNTANATQIDTIPAGHTVQLSITQSASQALTLLDSDQTTLTGGRTTFTGISANFDRAGVGINGDQGQLTTPANIDIARFTKSAARDSSGWADFNRSGLTRLVVNKVVDTSSGTSSGGVLIAPTPLGTGTNDGTFTDFGGQLSGV